MIKYAVVKEMVWFMSMVNKVVEYMWRNDPLGCMEVAVFEGVENKVGVV